MRRSPIATFCTHAPRNAISLLQMMMMLPIERQREKEREGEGGEITLVLNLTHL